MKKDISFQVKLDKIMHEKLRKEAYKTRSTIGSIVRTAIDEYFKKRK